jgi:hypothetical protein
LQILGPPRLIVACYFSLLKLRLSFVGEGEQILWLLIVAFIVDVYIIITGGKVQAKTILYPFFPFYTIWGLALAHLVNCCPNQQAATTS